MTASVWAMIPESSLPIQVQKSVSLTVAAGAHTVFTASGACIVEYVIPYNDIAATGLTSLHLDTDDTTPIALLASTLLAALTGGVNLALYNTPFLLEAGKHIVLTTVGTGTGGDLEVNVKYYPMDPGARLS